MSKNRNSKRTNKGNSSNKKVRRERGHWRDERQLIGSGHLLPIHPGLTHIECPDCGARAAGGQLALDHAVSCPIGKGYADAAADDRAWFASHPEASERVRPPTMPELQAVMLVTGRALPDMPLGVRYEPAGEVTVTKINEDIRERNFSAAMLLAAPALSTADGYHPDEFDASGQMWFREHLAPGAPHDDELWQW